MRLEELQDTVKLRLGEDVMLDLGDWYRSIVNYNCDYVVFITERCYKLAMIMEELSDLKMNGKSRFLTNTSFMMQVQKLVDIYKETKSLPHILICDDVTIYGRNINYFLTELERNLLKLMPEVNKDDIRNQMQKLIMIKTYIKSDDENIVKSVYNIKMTYKNAVSHKTYRKVANNISLLIKDLGLSGAAYVYSESINNEQFNRLDISSWINTSYQNTNELTLVKFLERDNDIIAIHTLRLVQLKDGNWKLIPFVILPNMTNEETLRLVAFIVSKMQKHDFSIKEMELLNKIYKQPGKRTFNELITFILSLNILKEVERDISIAEKIRQEDIERVVRYYISDSWEETETFIRKVVTTDLFSLEELNNELLKIINSDIKLMSYDNSKENRVTKEQQYEIVDKLNNYFFNKAADEIKEDYKMSKANSLTDASKRRYAEGCRIALSSLSAGYSKKQAEYMIAYLMQMVDAEVINITCYKPSKIKVLGYAQFIKRDRQAVLVKVLDYWEYIKMMNTFSLTMDTEDLKDEIKSFYKSGYSSIPESKFDEIIDLWLTLKELGQSPADWNSNYSFKIDAQYHIKRKGYNDMREYLNIRNKYNDEYKEFLKYLRQ